MQLGGLKVRKNEPIALDDLAQLDSDGLTEHRSIIYKRMEFAVLPAGVGGGGKVPEKRRIELTSGERRR